MRCHTIRGDTPNKSQVLSLPHEHVLKCAQNLMSRVQSFVLGGGGGILMQHPVYIFFVDL